MPSTALPKKPNAPVAAARTATKIVTTAFSPAESRLLMCWLPGKYDILKVPDWGPFQRGQLS